MVLEKARRGGHSYGAYGAPVCDRLGHILCGILEMCRRRNDVSFSRPSGSGSVGGKPEKAKNPAWMGSGGSGPARRSAQMWKSSAQKERGHEQRQRLQRAIAVGIASLLVVAF